MGICWKSPTSTDEAGPRITIFITMYIHDNLPLMWHRERERELAEVNRILTKQESGETCNSIELKYIKGWLKDTIIQVGTGDVKVLERIQQAFPVEYGEYLDESAK